MNQTYTGRTQRRKPSDKPKKVYHLGRMLLRQTIAALVCAAVVLGMRFLPLHLTRYTEALGKALRYEPNYAAMVENCKDFANRLWEKVQPNHITEH